MFDIENNTNQLVFTLPQQTQDGILEMLDYWHGQEKQYWSRMYYAENEGSRKYLEKYYMKYKDKQQAALELLNSIGVYPVIGWAGHRNKYFFPTESDYEAQQEWRYQCREDVD